MELHDLTGSRSGKLTMVERIPCRIGRYRSWWKCLCDCGRTCHDVTSMLTSGRRKSCGCTDLRLGDVSRRDRIILFHDESGWTLSMVANALGMTRNTVAGVLHRNGRVGHFKRPTFWIRKPKKSKRSGFEDDPRAVRPDCGRIGLPPPTEVGMAATPLIDAINGRWNPDRNLTSER